MHCYSIIVFSLYNYSGRPLDLDVDVSTVFLTDGVNVFLQWTHSESFASYNVTTTPPTAPSVSLTSANFIADYNTLYVVSVVAQLQCGQDNVPSNIY